MMTTSVAFDRPARPAARRGDRDAPGPEVSFAAVVPLEGGLVSDASDAAQTFPEPPDGLIIAPENRVLAQMEDPPAVAAAIDDLAEAGFDRDEIWVLCGPEGAERLDVTGRDHGLKGRIYRVVERIGDERDLLLSLEEHLSAGGLVVTVPADDETKASAARILGDHGGHDMAHFGKGHWERVGG